jgi:outer membrane protein assembly factor BamB
MLWTADEMFWHGKIGGGNSVRSYGRWRFLLLLCLLAATGSVCLGQSLGFQITSDHTGSQKWSVNLGGTASYPIIAGNRIFVIGGNPTSLDALDAETGNLLWSQIVPQGYQAWVGATYDNGLVFIVSIRTPSFVSGAMFAFSAIDGHQVWMTMLPSQSKFKSAPTASNGIVYTSGVSEEGTLYAVRESDGALLWASGVASGFSSSPAVTPNGAFVSFVCPQTDRYDPSGGQLLWHFSGGCYAGAGASPAQYQGLVYVRGALNYPTDGITLNAENGAYAGGFDSTYLPAFWQNLAFYTESSYLTAVDVATSQFLWFQLLQNGDSFSCAPVVVNGVVYSGTAQGNLYGISGDTGSLVFSANLGQGVACPEGGTPPQAGLSAGAGLLVVPAGGQLTAFQFDNFGAWQFVPSAPCRLVDTRQTNDPIQGGTSQNFDVPQLGGCNIPTTATAYSLNVTVVPHGSLGYLTVWPTAEVQPTVSTMNSSDGPRPMPPSFRPATRTTSASMPATPQTSSSTSMATSRRLRPEHISTIPLLLAAWWTLAAPTAISVVRACRPIRHAILLSSPAVASPQEPAPRPIRLMSPSYLTPRDNR